jgi:peptidoglycan/xylan/chitin deacetylase (PgdA/CDA1 family)
MPPRENFRKLSGSLPTPPHCVVLTYDDGPGPKTGELARLLRRENIPATFFVLGESVDLYPGVLGEIRACGHRIGLHGDEHEAFTQKGTARGQLDRCREKVRGFLGDEVWFRPPFGREDLGVEGYRGPVGWEADGEDWEITYGQRTSISDCVEMIVSRLHATDGGIVLLHDYAPPSEMKRKQLRESDLNLQVVEITISLIQRLRSESFSFIDLAESPLSPGEERS